ncbi:uncharacterized protein TRIADDRAFT_54231 [Trichoplax adhaerens]|uniref:VWFD domain-containing protein n=1 Tax=Trichoplax adhaerens TaxID=10228 RepID=B3RRG7_TRIAD|nr:hypothetical protein TRIADDRAFT_54231 [Trichoplax adhaerens]EDV26872.1 hypothetical protein TRIADDRAFT_54231 [Trichoplax adhaerens]|eukprot:XP_002110868.1 hypothetical protein TRIADDRAFT_54231 [Trichoplax adhaerens]
MKGGISYLMAIILLACLTATLVKMTAGQGIMGESVKCSKEGEIIKTLMDKTRNLCIICVCKNKIADCSSTCPKLPDSCTTYEYRKDSCCRICKGCTFKNRIYSHDEKWTIQVKDGEKSYWKRLICQNGLITMHKIECFVPCKNPIYLDNHECPICEKCKFHGKKYNEGELFAPLADKNVICTCKGKVLTCMKKVCPILSCHPETRVVVEYEPGLFCQICSTLSTVNCELNGFRYQNGSQWEEGCKTCSCNNNVVKCKAITCPPLLCPSGKQPYFLPGKCCPVRCFSATDTCRVYQEFNSAHIRTFDKHNYPINGGCKYIIAKSCKPALANFTILGRFGARSSDNKPLLSHVYLYFGNSNQIVLLPTMRVKYNQRSVNLPYHQSNLLQIETSSSLKSIIVKTNFGLQLTFSKKSDLRVYASPDYAGKVGGICGNYNGNKNDDISIINGNSKTKLKDFLLKWKVGKGCNKFKGNHLLPTSCKKFLPQKAAAVCMWIYQVDFLPCTIDRNKYHQLCLNTTCNDCPYSSAEVCACKIQKQYALDCLTIKGINIRWDMHNKCAELSSKH